MVITDIYAFKWIAEYSNFSFYCFYINWIIFTQYMRWAITGKGGPISQLFAEFAFAINNE